jgi:hypothetical protein
MGFSSIDICILEITKTTRFLKHTSTHSISSRGARVSANLYLHSPEKNKSVRANDISMWSQKLFKLSDSPEGSPGPLGFLDNPLQTTNKIWVQKETIFWKPGRRLWKVQGIIWGNNSTHTHKKKKKRKEKEDSICLRVVSQGPSGSHAPLEKSKLEVRADSSCDEENPVLLSADPRWEGVPALYQKPDKEVCFKYLK